MIILNINYLVLTIALAILACFIAYESILIQDLKKLLWLNERQPKWKKWFKPIGVVIDKLRELLACPFCLSYHMGWLTNYFYWDMDIITSLLYAPIIILFVHAYRKFTL